MATRLQRTIQAPLLLSIAISPDGELDARRDRDIPWNVQRLKTYCQKYSQTGDGSDFRNEVEWAKKQLEMHGDLEVIPREFWRISNKGLIRLREIVLTLLDSLPLDRIEKLLNVTTHDAEQWLLCVLRSLPSEELFDLVHSPGIRCYSSLLASAIKLVPSDQLGNVLLGVYEELLALMFEYKNALIEESV